jgi:sugar lactone lactonase YvrE
VNEAAPADAGSDGTTADATADSGTGPEVLASGRDCPSDLRVSSGAIVWVDQGSLQNGTTDGVLATMPAAGCPEGGACIITLAADQHSPSAIEIDPLTGALYWASILDETIWSMPSGQTAPQVFAPAQYYARSLAIDDAALYWINAGGFGDADGEIRRAWLEDGTPGGLPIVSALDSPVALARRESMLFWSNDGISDTTGYVMRADVTGFGATTIASDQSHPRGIAVGPTHVYWTNTGDGTIMRARYDGSESTRLLSNRATPSDIALDTTHMYWVDAGTPVNFTDGSVHRATLDGTEIETIATGQLDPRRIALDSSHVYWINRGTQGVSKCSQHDGAVMRAPKP